MSIASDRAADAGMQQALQAESNQEWMAAADRWLSEQPRGTLFTADDVVAAIGRPHQIAPGKNNAIGAWTNSRARRGWMEDTGRRGRSSRVEGHGNELRIWRVQVPEDQHRAGGDAERLGPDGVSSSSRGSTYPAEKVEASTAPEASRGWDDQADPEQTCDGGHGQDVAPTGSADGARAETAHRRHAGEGDPGSALSADAPPRWVV